MMAWTVGIGYAGDLFGQESAARDKGNDAAADVPRELAMRPLPLYRIAPPDIIAIEVTACGGAPASGSRIGKGVGLEAASGRGMVVGNVTGGGLTKVGRHAHDFRREHLHRQHDRHRRRRHG